VIQNGAVIDQAKYNVYIREKQYALIDSGAEKQEASLYTELSGGGLHREDIYYLGERDYIYSNFITIPSGTSTFLMTAANSQFGKCTVSFSIQKTLC
jgi:hypothetical protein